jgi:hypothetical protein
MRRRLLSCLSILALLLAGSLVTAPAAAAHPYCGQVWGSQAKSAGDMSAGMITNVRAGRHACFDRLVLDVDAPLTGWSVEYVDQVVLDGAGNVLPLRGGARLAVVARVGALATDAFFTGFGSTVVDTSRYRTFRHVAWGGTYEGVTTIGLGVRARLPFRAFVLPGPGAGSRLVVDVGHRWCAPGHVRC